MSTTTSEITQAPSPAAETRNASTGDEQGFLRRYVWWFVALGVLVLSAVLVRTLGTRPGYDPYGWLIWGRETLSGTLDLGGAPSWKPLPYLFTVPYSVFGHFALWLWMVTAVAISLGGSIFAGRVAYRLTGTDDGKRRFPAIAAAVFAGLALFGIWQYMHSMFSAQSDTVITALCLGAIDFHLSRRFRIAFVLLVLGALGRPEVWPFTGLYGLWLWWKHPSSRWLVAAGFLLIPAMWFGIPTITNHRPFVSAQLALRSPREVTGNKVTGVLNRYATLHYLPLQLAALLGFVMAWFRRDRVVLALGGAVILWVIVEAAFALHGWPAVPRYIYEAEGVTIVIAAVAVGWLLKDGLALAERHRPGWARPRWIGIALVAILTVSLVPPAIARLRDEHKDVSHERSRTKEINLLAKAVSAYGGYKHLRACGEPVTNVEYVSILAWYTHLNVGNVGHRPKFEVRQKYPIVLFTQLQNGWAMTPYRTSASLQSTCPHALFVTTPHRPNGVYSTR
ncbi:MAG: hypothetical protein ACXVUE_06810 [Solirubrobacteraceae bacterium]